MSNSVHSPPRNPNDLKVPERHQDIEDDSAKPHEGRRASFKQHLHKLPPATPKTSEQLPSSSVLSDKSIPKHTSSTKSLQESLRLLIVDSPLPGASSASVQSEETVSTASTGAYAESVSKPTVPDNSPPFAESVSMPAEPDNSPAFAESVSTPAEPNNSLAFAESVSTPAEPNNSPAFAESVSKPAEPDNSPAFAESVSKPVEPNNSPAFAESVSKPVEPDNSPAFAESVSKPMEPDNSPPNQANTSHARQLIEKRLASTKRKAIGPDALKQNVMKQSRELGQVYEKKNGGIANARIMGEMCNCKTGQKQCPLFTNEDRSQIFNHIWTLSWEEKRNFVYGLVAQMDVKRRRSKARQRNRQYTFEYSLIKDGRKHMVCSKMFLSTTGLTKHFVQSLFQFQRNDSFVEDTEDLTSAGDESLFLQDIENDSTKPREGRCAFFEQHLHKLPPSASNTLEQIPSSSVRSDTSMPKPASTPKSTSRRFLQETLQVLISLVDSPLPGPSSTAIQVQTAQSKEAISTASIDAFAESVSTPAEPDNSPPGQANTSHARQLIEKSLASTIRKAIGPDAWKQNVMKQRRELGQVYEKKNGEIANARIMGEECKCKTGQKQCPLFTNEDRSQIFNHIWTLSWEEKRNFVYGLVTQMDVKRKRSKAEQRNRQYTFEYSLKKDGQKCTVCSKMFLSTTGLSKHFVQSLFQRNNSFVEDNEDKETTSQDGPLLIHLPKKQRLNPHYQRSEESRHILHQFLNALPKMPSDCAHRRSSKVYLDQCFKSLSEIHKCYGMYCTERNTTPLKLSVFKEVFHEKKFSLFLPKRDRCNTCIGYEVGKAAEIE